VKFFKDGYTDHRGRFDYVSLSTDALSNAVKFALLIMSETFGAVVLEATPPNGVPPPVPASLVVPKFAKAASIAKAASKKHKYEE